MTILRLDHVNIATARLEESIDFYGAVLGLSVHTPPMAADRSGGAWAHDASGRAVVHLFGAREERPGEPPPRGIAQPGAIDHFALACDDLRPVRERLEARGLPYELLDLPQIRAQLLFVRDPNGVMVELNQSLAVAADAGN